MTSLMSMGVAVGTLALSTEMSTRATLVPDSPEILSGNLTQTTDILPETESQTEGDPAATHDPVVFEESTWSEVITTHFIVVLVVLVVTGQLIWLARYYNRKAKPFGLPDVVHYTGVSTTAFFKPPTDPIPLIF